jgi:hypothetical protein
VDALRHVLSALVEAFANDEKKLLLHAVMQCQADVLLHPWKNDVGLIRLHYQAAAAETARVYDAITRGGARRSSVVQMMGERWVELNGVTAVRELSRPPSPVYEDMAQGQPYFSLDPPRGAELAFNSEVWLQNDEEVMSHVPRVSEGRGAGGGTGRALAAPLPRQKSSDSLSPKRVQFDLNATETAFQQQVAAATASRSLTPTQAAIRIQTCFRGWRARQVAEARRRLLKKRASAHFVTAPVALAPRAAVKVSCSLAGRKRKAEGRERAQHGQPAAPSEVEGRVTERAGLGAGRSCRRVSARAPQ